jgi:hypothetical protein
MRWKLYLRTRLRDYPQGVKRVAVHRQFWSENLDVLDGASSPARAFQACRECAIAYRRPALFRRSAPSLAFMISPGGAGEVSTFYSAA